MPLGAGKFDDECTLIREAYEAAGVAVLVLGGTKGNGFSMQGTIAAQLALPEILEDMARGIRADLPALIARHAKTQGGMQ